MRTSFTYVVCSVGCSPQMEEQDGRVLNISGNRYSKGHGYALQEMTAPVRSIATSIRIRGGELPPVSVRLSVPILKKDIFGATEEIRKVTIHVPVHIGDVAIRHLLGTEVDVVVTENVLEAWYPDGPMLAVKGG